MRFSTCQYGVERRSGYRFGDIGVEITVSFFVFPGLRGCRAWGGGVVVFWIEHVLAPGKRVKLHDHRGRCTVRCSPRYYGPEYFVIRWMDKILHDPGYSIVP